MNKKKRQQCIVVEMSQSAARHVVTEEEIKQYLTYLIPEWNLRLLMDADASANIVLWVESVTVTAYQSAPETKSSGKLNLWKRCIQWLKNLF